MACVKEFNDIKITIEANFQLASLTSLNEARNQTILDIKEMASRIGTLSDEEVSLLVTIFNNAYPGDEISSMDLLGWLGKIKIEETGEPKLDSPMNSIENYEEASLPKINFIEDVYGGSSAKNSMLRLFNSEIIQSIIVDLVKEREVLGDTETLNINILEMQNRLYKNILDYINDYGVPNSLPLELYDVLNIKGEATSLNTLDSFLRGLTGELNSFFGFRIGIDTLSGWRRKAAVGDSTFIKKLRAYNSYFILKNFDKLLAHQFGNFIKCLDLDSGKLLKKLDKYDFDFSNDSNKIKTWQQEDLQGKGAYDVIPKHLLRFIESCEILDFSASTGEPAHTNKFLKKDHISYFVSKIKKDFRTSKYNLKHIVYVENASDSVVDIKNKLDFSTGNGLLKGKDKQISENLREQLALMLYDLLPDLYGRRVLYLENIVNNIRDHSKQTLKALFDVRRLLDIGFSNDIEKRIFDNLYYYMFADRHSLWKSSLRIYGELALLFDTTSMVDLFLYSIDVDGNVRVSRLSPEMVDLNLNILKRRINSLFSTGNIDYLLKRYDVKINDSIDKKTVEFTVKDYEGQEWKFKFGAKELQKWSMSRPYAKDPSKREEFNPATSQLTNRDLSVLGGFIKDTLLIDIISDPELKIAVLSLYKNSDGSENLNKALYSLLDMAVNIFSNAAFFRRVDLAGIKFTEVKDIQPEKLYIAKEYKDGRLVKSPIYTTTDNTPISFSELQDRFGTMSARFKTKEQIKKMQEKGVEIGIEDVFSFRNVIENWFGDEDILRTNATYLSVDIISARQSKNLEAIAKAQALLDGSTFKSLVKTAERTNITIGQSSMLLAERFTRLGKYSRAANHPMTVLWNNLKKAVNESVLLREAQTTAGVKLNKDFNFKENFYSCFVIDFLLPLYAKRNWNVKFTEAVNSDKPNVPKIIIDNITKILTADLAKDKIKEVLCDTYRQCFNNIQADLKTLTEHFNNNMKTEGQSEISISLERNFEDFNNWCAANNVDPTAMLAKISLDYNLKNRKNPLAIAENIHYHTNYQTGKLEINFSFLDALAKYTMLSSEDVNKRISNLKDEISKTLDIREKLYLGEILDLINHDYNNRWNDTIKEIIKSNNTREQLSRNGDDTNYEIFKNRYVNNVEVTDPTTGLPSEYEVVNFSAYDNFINTSNVTFILKLLKNDVAFDLIQLENKTQIIKFVDGVVDQIPELLKEFTELMAKDPDNEKTHRTNLKKKFTREWFTPGWDRMAFGILLKLNAKGEWKNITQEYLETNEEEDISKSTEGWLKYPVQLSTYADLSTLHINEGGRRIEYTDPDFNLSSDNLYYTNEKGKEIKVRVKVNPILEQYNLNSHYWTTLSSFATTGSHLWSDPKAAANTLLEECFKWFDNNKRNVINSATKLQFELGDIWGVTKMANIAIVDDIIAECTDILGSNPKVKPYDGATFVNAFMHYWENYSLNNQITGFTKKPIHEFYDERVMAGGLDKTASFAITNNTMRNSFNLERMHWKMSNNVWSDNNGNPLEVDLTLGLDLTEGLDKEDPHSEYLGNHCIGLSRVDYTYKGTNKTFRGPMYFKNTKDGRMVEEIVEFKSLGKNQYRIRTKTINPNLPRDPLSANPDNYIKREDGLGDEIHTDIVTINNNYDFWKVLGGYNSVEYNLELDKYEYSEASIKTVADWAAKIRFREGPNGLLIQQKYSQKTTKNTAKDRLIAAHIDLITGTKFSHATDSYSDRDDRLNYCPLKHSDVHYLVTRGATKKYAANINSKEAYHSDAQLNFFKIRMSEAGILLDPTHEADLSIVSMMTQVISALAERGYTNELAQEVYEALSELTSLAIADDMAAFELYFTAGDRRQLLNIVSKLIVQEFMESKASTRDANVARAITERLIAEGRRGEHLKLNKTYAVYPFSDPSMYNLLLTTITSAMNKKAIRAKMFGTLSVLNPSHELFKVFGNRLLSEFTSFAEIISLLSALDKKPIKLQLAEIGKTYRVVGGIYDGEIFTLNNSDNYYAWKSKLARMNYNLVEQLYNFEEEIQGNKQTIGEEIKRQNNQFNFFKFKTDSGKEFIKRIGDINDLLDNITSAQKITLYGRNLGSHNYFYTGTNGEIGNRYDFKTVLDNRYIEIYDNLDKTFNELRQENPLITMSEVLDYLKISDLTMRNFYRKTYQDVLNGKVLRKSKLEREKELLWNLLGLKNHGKAFIYNANNEALVITVGSYRVKNFEAILPMVYAELFGIRKGDTIADIIADKDFFVERILENYIEPNKPENSLYDICIKRANGKHFYIKYVDSNEVFDKEGFEKLNIDIYTDDDGTFRMDKWNTSKKLHPLSSKEDSIYYDKNSKQEILVTNNLNFYLKELKYTDINISLGISEHTLEKLTEALQENNGKIICKTLLDNINTSGYDVVTKSQADFVELVYKFTKNAGRKNKDERATLLSSLEELAPEFMDKIKALAKKQRVSFFQSLNFTVARIPAQGMQSFMAMEIVGFNDTGVNDCYVSAEQIRLQGSDYDVDKATFMGFAYDKTGQFVKWSPFFKMYSSEELKASMDNLPYPNGRTANKNKGSENSIDFSKYVDLFEKKEVLNTQKSYEDEEENLDNDITLESTENQKTVYVLKKKRSQALLGQMLREIKAIATDLISRNIYSKTYSISFNPDTVEEELVDAIIQTANRHNTYINKVEKEEKENLLKNFVSYKTFSVAQNPANAVAGETTVDESAKPWKKLGNSSVMGSRPQDSLPGDSSIFWSALFQNHTGKDVIAIAASAGLKCFHAITQVFNLAIKNRKNLKELWFNVNMENPLTVAGDKNRQYDKTYHFVADPYLGIEEFMDPNLTPELLEELKLQFITGLQSLGLSNTEAKNILDVYLNHSEWAGSNDSGILTLATDNAKELMLDRLNAGKDLAGLYLYGISIGMKGEDIFKIMTSPTAQVLARLTRDNLFTADYLNESLSNAITFIKQEDPRTPTESRYGERLAVYISAEKTIELNNLFKKLNLDIEGITIPDAEKLDKISDKVRLLLTYEKPDGKRSTIQEAVIKASLDGNIEKYIKRLKFIKNRVLYNAKSAKSNDNKTHKFGYTYEELEAKKQIDKLITYTISLHEIVNAHKLIDPEFKGNMWADLNNISTLNEGYRETAVLRGLLGLNQGAKTKTEEKYKFYEDFTSIIKNRVNQIGKISEGDETAIKTLLGDSMRIDLEKFMEDEQYLQQLITLYDRIKHTYNPLRIVLSLPHFASYLRASISDYNKARGVSLKFRTMVDVIVPYIHNEMKIRSSRETPVFYKKGEEFINSLLSNKFLEEENSILIPRDNKIFYKEKDSEGNDVLNSKTYSYAVPIRLGTIEGNETFRTWMNNEVIPRLHDLGLSYAPDVSIGLRIKISGSEASGVNTFLKDLTPNITNQTFDKNNIKIFALPIDMIPKSDVELDKLARYRTDFMDLRNYKYLVDNLSGYNLLDLFFYYNLINFRNLGGTSSLTTLYEPLIYEDNSIINRYYKFIAEMDTSYELNEGVDYTEEMLQKALAPTSREMSATKANTKKIPYFNNLNRDTLKYEFYKRDEQTRKVAQEEEYSVGYLGRNNYFKEQKRGISIYPTYDKIYELKDKTISSIEVGNVLASVNATYKDGIPVELDITNINIKLPENSLHKNERPKMKDINISGDTLKKMIKLRSVEGLYEYTLNPISVLAYVSSLREFDCN